MTDPGPAEAVRDPADLLVPALPGTRRDWIEVVGQLSGLFLALRDAEITDGAVLPDPLRSGRAAGCWARASAPLVTAFRCGVLDGVRVPAPDVDVLGDAAEVLGRHLLRERLGAEPDDLTTILRREARTHGREPERLVVHLARAHGVLTAGRPEPALAVWAAGR